MSSVSEIGVTIVLPTYNERENIQVLIPRICGLLKGKVRFEILVVDDDSPDGTWRVAMELSKKFTNVRVRRRIGERGLASAILEGIRLASYDAVIVMDADLQHPPEVLTRIIDKLRMADVVVASRYIAGGGIKGWSLLRKVISLGATLLAHYFIPESEKVTDPMSGYFGIKKHVVEGVKLNTIGFKMLLEILAKGKYSSVVEVPYIFESRKYGASKLSFKVMSEYLRHLIILLRQTKRIHRLGLPILVAVFLFIILLSL